MTAYLPGPTLLIGQRDALGQLLTPSVVGLDDEGRVLVGQTAKERLLTQPHLTTALFKRYMGTQHSVPLGDLMIVLIGYLQITYPGTPLTQGRLKTAL